MEQVTIEQALAMPDALFVDLRSPGEYARGSIPGALSLPLFTDSERAAIGLTYRAEGITAAKLKGLTFVAPKLPSIARRLSDLRRKGTPVVYCWRGGLRSDLLARTMELIDIPVLRIAGGYKAFRRHVLDTLAALPRDEQEVVVLHGLTGVGKTQIIRRLQRKGYAAVDLEGLANHRGSVFGHIGLPPSPSQKDFEALLHVELRKHAGAPYLLVEGEGQRLWNLIFPERLVAAMQRGKQLLLQAPLEERVRNILSDYPYREAGEQIKGAIVKLKKRLGETLTRQLLDDLDSQEYARVVRTLCTAYYDRLYDDANPQKQAFDLILEGNTPRELADRLAAYLDKTGARRQTALTTEQKECDKTK